MFDYVLGDLELLHIVGSPICMCWICVSSVCLKNLS